MLCLYFLTDYNIFLKFTCNNIVIELKSLLPFKLWVYIYSIYISSTIEEGVLRIKKMKVKYHKIYDTVLF